MRTLSLVTPLLFASSVAMADDFIHWQNTDLTLLYGDKYEVVSDEQTTVTFTHVNGNAWGDFFMFYDALNYRGGGESQYGEISPRFSASKIFGADFSNSIIQDVLLTTTFEFGYGNVESLLYGIAVDLKVPGFDFLQLNTYKRDPNNNQSEGYQFTPVWQMTFPVGQSEIVFDGFIDWVFKSDNDAYQENVHFNPQLKYDLGMAIWGKASKGKLYAGIEYDYWSNKFGISSDAPIDVDQSTFSWIVRYHF